MLLSRGRSFFLVAPAGVFVEDDGEDFLSCSSSDENTKEESESDASEPSEPSETASNAAS